MITPPPAIFTKSRRLKRWFVVTALAATLWIGWIGLRPLLVKSMLLPRLVLKQPVPSLRHGWSFMNSSEDIGAVALSPGGSVVWSGGDFSFVDVRGKTYLSPAHATIQAWDAHTGKPLYSLPGHRRLVDALAVSPDGRYLASSGWDDSVKLWDTFSHQQVWSRPGTATALTFSPDGQQLAVHGEIWDAHTGRLIRVLSEKTWEEANVDFSPDGATFACVDGNFKIVSDPEGITQGNNRDPQQGTYGVVGEHPQMWDTETGRLIRTLPYNLGQSVTFSPDGKWLACLCEVSDQGVGAISGAAIYLIDAQTGAEKWRWLRRNEGHTVWGMTSLHFSPNGKWLAGVTLDSKVVILNASTGAARQVLSSRGAGYTGGGRDTPSALAFSDDGETLVVRGATSVLVWDTSSLR